MKKKEIKYQKKHTLQCYLLLSPQIIGFFVFTIYPILWAIKMSLYYYNTIPLDTRFVGLQNYVTMFTEDKRYWETWVTTLEFTLMKLILEIPLALFIAVILKRKLKAKGFFRAVYFMPALVGGAIVGVIFNNLFSYLGLINAWILEAGGTPIDWYGTKAKALLFLVIASTWTSFGTNVLYFVAALSNVSEDIYESAKIDGANSWQIFIRMTMPMILPTFGTILLLAINGTIHVNDFIIVMTNGAPAGKTYTVMSYITGNYAPGFGASTANVGYGCALSFVTSLLMCLFAIGYMQLKKKLENIY
ncbi:MAG TPA: sugar ABC transporter permease [Candidatus Eisenbergiella merdipullorum]|uniref:Sugar ABC transporter permease n=1 Tax=Candidatus Eisenbergiella merdipullorum TaxID=2838553 RepID=A0A9D2I8S1_9FIRM|nr:sugar ABC transporter permease [Candidatus Eisenbergiella merdipullorum]